MDLSLAITTFYLIFEKESFMKHMNMQLLRKSQYCLAAPETVLEISFDRLLISLVITALKKELKKKRKIERKIERKKKRKIERLNLKNIQNP